MRPWGDRLTIGANGPGKIGEENRASLLVLCALFAHSCKGGIQMYSIVGGKGFHVLYDM